MSDEYSERQLKDIEDAKELALEEAEATILRAVDRNYVPDPTPDMNTLRVMFRNTKTQIFFDTYEEEYSRLVPKLFAEYTPEVYEPKNKTWEEMVSGEAPDGSMKI